MSNRTQAKTQAALALIRQGLTPYRAALRAGISPSTIYRHLAKERVKSK